MEKIVISSSELAAVPERAAPASGLPKPPAPPPIALHTRLLLTLLIPFLPVLCLAGIGIHLVTRHKELRVRHAWARFLSILLIASGLFSSVAGVIGLALLRTPTVPQSAIAPPERFDFPEIRQPRVNPATPLAAREIARMLRPAIFIVAKENKRWPASREWITRSGFGTGALIFADAESGLLITCRHVIDGERWDRAKPYEGSVLLGRETGSFARARIAARHKELDLLLLELPRGEGESLFIQKVLPLDDLAVGERVTAFGHPEGLFFSLSDGIVSRVDESGLIQITAPVGPGASGGPVYDSYGVLVGIITSMLSKSVNPQAENVNFATRADALLVPQEWNFVENGEKLLAKLIAAQDAPPPPAPAASAEEAPK